METGLRVMTPRKFATHAALAVAVLWPAAGQPADGVHPGPMSRTQAFARAEALTAIGRKMFFDPSLSASGRQACSSCHDPNHAFGPASAAPVEMG
ncbi:MAG: cytochrome-c peroxidase, partial [Mesorhizobium sp.]